MSRSLLFRAIVRHRVPDLCASPRKSSTFGVPDLQLHPVGAFDGADLIVRVGAFEEKLPTCWATTPSGAELTSCSIRPPIVISGAERNPGRSRACLALTLLSLRLDDCVTTVSISTLPAWAPAGRCLTDREFGSLLRERRSFPTVAAGDSDSS